MAMYHVQVEATKDANLDVTTCYEGLGLERPDSEVLTRTVLRNASTLGSGHVVRCGTKMLTNIYIRHGCPQDSFPPHHYVWLVG